MNENDVLIENLNLISDVYLVSTSQKDFLNIPKQDNRVLFLKQAEALFGSIDALVRIAGTESDDPHVVFMDTLRLILRETKEGILDTFLDILYLPSDQRRDVHIAATKYFIQFVVNFIGVSAEIEKLLIKKGESTKTSLPFQLFQYQNYRNAEKDLADWVDEYEKTQYNREGNFEAILQAANDLVKNHPAGQGILGGMNRFHYYRDVQQTVSHLKSRPSEKQQAILKNEKKQFEFMLAFFDRIDEMQKAAKLPPKALDVPILTPVAELIPAKVKGWDTYFSGMLRKAVFEWVEYLSPCLDPDVINAPGRAKGLLGKEVKRRAEEDISRNRERIPYYEDTLPPTEMALLPLEDKMTAVLSEKLKKHKIKESPENIITAFTLKSEGCRMKEIFDITRIPVQNFNRYKKLFRKDPDLLKQLTEILTPPIHSNPNKD